jgi:hypothetical protein
MNYKCECGGPIWPDFFEHPRKPVEWFMRCPWCDARGPSAITEEDSITAWVNGKVSIVIDSKECASDT